MENYWEDKNVFVTGCSGFLGSWLTKALVDQKANVIGLIRDTVPKSNLQLSGYVNKITAVNGKLEDYDTICRVLNEYEIDVCFHLGAQTIVSTANRNPISTFETNIKGTWNVLEAARNSKTLAGLIVASSDKAYGIHETLPYDENAPLRGSHPYDVSKTCTDLLAQSFYNTYSLPVSITRLGNIYGGGDLNFSRIVPGTIKSILSGQEPVIRSDGKFIRDYIYVNDAANAYMSLAENIDNEKVVGNAFNFSSEEPISVIDLVNTMIQISGTSIRPKILNEAKGEIRDQYLTSKKSRELLGWKTQYTLRDGLKETFDWYSRFFSSQSSRKSPIASYSAL